MIETGVKGRELINSQLLLSNINIGILCVDQDFRIITFNSQAKEWFPKIEEGVTCCGVFSWATKQCHKCICTETFSDGQKHGLTIKKREGRKSWYYKITASPIQNINGRISLITLTLQDITEITLESRKLERQVQKTQRIELIGTLTGGIAHDLNNILSPILGFGEILLEKSPDPIFQEDLNEILTAARRARELITQILAFSRESEQTREVVEIEIIIKEVLRLIRLAIPSTIKITKNLEKCGLIMADPTQIYQVAMNIIINACQALKGAEGELKVYLREIDITSNKDDIIPGRYAVLIVSDTGYGIKSEIIEKIFDPYFTTKDREKGNGLGLSLTRSIVKSHGGAIKVDSKPGQGTEFQIFFPVIDNYNPFRIKPISKKPIVDGSERIIIVDDEEVITKMLRRGLGSKGYQVIDFNDGQKVLDIFRDPQMTKIFDLAIIDIFMPKLSGDILSKGLLKINPHLPIILMTGHLSLCSDDLIKKIGIKKIVKKPIAIRELARIIREILDNR